MQDLTQKEQSPRAQKKKKAAQPRRNQGIFNFASAKQVKLINPRYQTNQTTTKNFFQKKQELDDREIYGKNTSNCGKTASN